MTHRILLLGTTTGYQTRSFGEAAARLGVELLFATDRCHVLEDPWRDNALPVKFYAEDESVTAILEAATARPIDGILAVGDRPTVLAALAARALGLPGNSVEAARASCNKLLARERLQTAGLPCPWFRSLTLESWPTGRLPELAFPCVVKPLALSASRGVMRVNDLGELQTAVDRLRALLSQPDVQALRDPANASVIVEQFINGQEYALEGILERGQLRVLALFDKPDPLEGPFFEETIYVTPSALPPAAQDAIVRAVAEAAAALGLWHGPVHAECRVNDGRVFILEIAARPIGGLCARAVRFGDERATLSSLEEILLRHARDESISDYRREACASAVMMMPIPREGFYKRVEGLDQARAVPGIEEILVTAKPDQHLVPLPEGASYLGFMFARTESPATAVAALRAAHARLRVVIDTAIPVTVSPGPHLS